ncbi:MAG TPA: type II toxin-antitoxin system VapC family toxin [Phototrophicaceae bacterium]|jgi:tRNA(fMet)-specific endonuclease VapC|nr:type II toxin-antitoxin system VapC family toxin [Phototrophicaceae bacterium]
MKYLLDTNTCIRYINGRSPQIRAKLPTIPVSEVGVSIITRAELFYGSTKSQTPERSRQKQLEFLQPIQTVPFDEAAAVVYGDIRAYLERQGSPIGGNCPRVSPYHRDS